MYEGIVITDIDAEIERQRDIEYCGEYMPSKNQETKSNVYIDPCADKPCFAKCTFEIFISCGNNWLNE